MRECTTVSTDSAPLTPNKRVDYRYGQVLGVAEFRALLSHRPRGERVEDRFRRALTKRRDGRNPLIVSGVTGGAVVSEHR